MPPNGGGADTPGSVANERSNQVQGRILHLGPRERVRLVARVSTRSVGEMQDAALNLVRTALCDAARRVVRPPPVSGQRPHDN